MATSIDKGAPREKPRTPAEALERVEAAIARLTVAQQEHLPKFINEMEKVNGVLKAATSTIDEMLVDMTAVESPAMPEDAQQFVRELESAEKEKSKI